jgi:hypothetical protein
MELNHGAAMVCSEVEQALKENFGLRRKIAASPGGLD